MERVAALGVRAIVCTDIVGSTAIRSRIGDDRADALKRDHDELMGGIVATHRGRVMRWTGDGVQCEFTSASAAIAAAVDMLRGVRRYGLAPDAVAPFDVRIGVAVGEVTVDGDDAHGVAVIEAVRLEALAAPGEILATDLVERLGRRRSDAVFEEVGERRLKGLDAPVQVMRIVDTFTGPPVQPLPRSLTLDRRFPLVGRDVPLAAALQSWREVAAGATRTVLISGEPGAGKSRLIAQVADRAYAEGAVVLAGACDSDVIVPYQPFAMALREVEADEEIVRAVTRGEGAIGPLYAAHRRGGVDELGASDRIELFAAVADLLGRLAGDRPLARNWIAAYGLALLGRGDRDGAAAVLDGFEVPPIDCFWLTTLQCAAELAVGLGHVEWCGRLAALLAPYADLVGVTAWGSLCFGLVSTTLAGLHLALGEHASAEELARASVTRADAMGAAFERARSRRLLVEAMAARGDTGPDAARIAAEGLAVAERFGFSAERRRLQLLAGAGPGAAVR